MSSADLKDTTRSDRGRNSKDAADKVAQIAVPHRDSAVRTESADVEFAVRYRPFSLGRIFAIATNTLTDLTRQKVFYFVLIFALLLIASSIFMARLSFQQEFQILKDVSLGAISIFTSLLAIVATARLLSQDIEDRTLYTILAKPVPRIEYLLGKLAGVLLLLAIATLVMSAVMVAIIYTREQTVLRETAQQLSNAPHEQLDAALNAIRSSALNRDIFSVIAIIYGKGCLLAALTLFVSTFATTNIFTVVVMVFIYFIGHLQATAREYWLQEHSSGWLTHTFLAVVALLFPDLQAFNLVDDVVAGTVIPAALLLKTSALAIFYTVVYTAFAAVAFYGKEL